MTMIITTIMTMTTIITTIITITAMAAMMPLAVELERLVRTCIRTTVRLESLTYIGTPATDE
ncbi:MAG TPA: hypothetical protein VMM76_22195 [Pirellulaceae bacterium]|nr:hypothetical protein [Pirellulaceae bacterium]